MNETNISFYLRSNRIHIFVDALRGVGHPQFISFLMDENGSTLLIVPYAKKDFYSHRVPKEVYNGMKGMEVSSKRLCQILAIKFKWDLNASYRAPGIIIPKQKIVKIYLNQAEKIEHDELFTYKNDRTVN